MTTTDQTTPAPESLEFRAEIRDLLNILAHSLYTNREIFLRELVSNASDALNRLRFEQLTNQDVLDPAAPLEIRIEIDAAQHLLRISDTGIGMTRDEIIENIGTIAHSGAKSFLNKLKEEKEAQGGNASEIIGQFGVGFYAVFMVADEVRVTSRSYHPDSSAIRWISRGENTYTIEPAEQTRRGTTVEIVLKDDATEFESTWRLEQIIRKHSNFVAFPIFVSKIESKTEADEAQDEDENEEDESPVEAKAINQQTAIWRRPSAEITPEQYQEFYKQLTFDHENPLTHIHLIADAPVQLYALLFIPGHREQTMLRDDEVQGPQLYSRKVLIQEHCRDLLPKHFRFVRGVVDSEDLPLNISRETVQSNQVMLKIKNTLTKRVQQKLEKIAEDKDEYKTFWKEFGVFIKEGIASEPWSSSDLHKLLRYTSSQNGEEETSLKEYVERMKPEQEEIYYVLGESLRAVAHSPHLEPFKARDLEVLYMIEPIDSFVMMGLREFEGKKFRNIDDPSIELPVLEKPEEGDNKALSDDDFGPVLVRFRNVLGERVVGVQESKSLVDSPARLVTPKDSADRDLQRVRRMMDEKYEIPKKILEVNRQSRLIQNVATRLHNNAEDPRIDLVIEQLFENSLLQEGLHPNPTEMITRIQQLMEVATQAAE